MIKEIIILIAFAACAYVLINTYVLGNPIDFSSITSGVTNFIKENPTITAIGALVGPTAVGAVSKLAYNSLKKEATETITNQSNVIVDKQTELQAVQSSYEQKIANMQTEIDTLKNMPNDALALQETIAQKEKQITNIQGGQDAILKLHDTFVKDLMSKAGNQTIVDPVTQKTYWVIEKPAITKVI